MSTDFKKGKENREEIATNGVVPRSYSVESPSTSTRKYTVLCPTPDEPESLFSSEKRLSQL